MLESSCGTGQGFILELFGETSPIVDANYADVLGPDQQAPQTSASAPVYEYWWTLSQMLNTQSAGDMKVSLYFPTRHGWRVKEIIAVLRYLTPYREAHKLWHRVQEALRVSSPVFSEVAEIAKLVPAASPVVPILNTMAKLSMASIPQSEVNWSVRKTTREGTADYQGIEWTIPEDAWEKLGERITGSVAVSIVAASSQQADVVGEADVASVSYSPAAVLCSAAVKGIHVPTSGEVSLLVRPREAGR